jgi:Flp pilus assembly protein TadG
VATTIGVAAVEFAMIIPLMAAMLIGTNEFAAGVAIDRKVTIMARTLSDLTSQNTEVTDAKLTNFFNAGKSIMTPYPSAPVQGTITELYINPTTLKARVQWSQGSRTAYGGRHHRHPGCAQDRRHLPDLERGQV